MQPIKKAFTIGDPVRIADTCITGTVCGVNTNGVSISLPWGDVIPVSHRPTHPPCGTPCSPRVDNHEWRTYDRDVNAWLFNAYAYNEQHDDDEIAQWIMGMECDEYYPHA